MTENAAKRNAMAEQGRQYMNRILEARDRVEELTERIRQCQAMIQQCSDALSVRVPGIPPTAQAEESLLTLVRLKERLSEEMEGYEARIRETEWAIDRLEDPLERQLLRYRYLCGKDMNQITTDMHYTDSRYVRKLMANALSHLRLGGRTCDDIADTKCL